MKFPFLTYLNVSDSLTAHLETANVTKPNIILAATLFMGSDIGQYNPQAH